MANSICLQKTKHHLIEEVIMQLKTSYPRQTSVQRSTERLEHMVSSSFLIRGNFTPRFFTFVNFDLLLNNTLNISH